MSSTYQIFKAGASLNFSALSQGLPAGLGAGPANGYVSIYDPHGSLIGTAPNPAAGAPVQIGQFELTYTGATVFGTGYPAQPVCSVQALIGATAGSGYTIAFNNNALAYCTFDVGAAGAPAWTGYELFGDTLILTGVTLPSGDGLVAYHLYSAASTAGPWTLLPESADTANFDLPSPATATYYRYTGVDNAGYETTPSAWIEVIPSQEDEMERATIFQGLTLAAETSLGVLAVSPKAFLLPSVIGEIKPMQQNKTFSGRGVKGALGKTRAKEHTEISLSGPLGYDELVFLMQSHLAASNPATIGTSTTAKQWNTLATSGAADTPASFTVQVGSAVAGAAQVSGCVVTDFSIKVTDTEATFTATMIGQVLVDSVNYVGTYPYLATPTEILTYPIHESGVGLYIGTNLAALTGLTHLIEFSIDSKNRWKPAFFRDPTKPSYSGFVEGKLSISGKLTVEEDSQANALLAQTRADNPIGAQSQTYLALQSTGPVIDATGDGVAGANVSYAVALEWPIILVKSPSRTDKSDVWAGEYDFEVANDSTIGCMTANITSQVLSLH